MYKTHNFFALTVCCITFFSAVVHKLRTLTEVGARHLYFIASPVASHTCTVHFYDTSCDYGDQRTESTRVRRNSSKIVVIKFGS